jgi:hypothetical protein
MAACRGKIRKWLSAIQILTGFLNGSPIALPAIASCNLTRQEEAQIGVVQFRQRLRG